MKLSVKNSTRLFLFVALIFVVVGSTSAKVAACRLTEREWFIDDARVVDSEVSMTGPYNVGECNNNTSNPCVYTFSYTKKSGSDWKVGADSLWLKVFGGTYREEITTVTIPYTVPAGTLAIFWVIYEERWDLYRGDLIQKAWCTECKEYHPYREGTSDEKYWSLRTEYDVDHRVAWL